MVASFRDSDQAKEALAKYRQFIVSSGKVQQDLSSPADGGFTGKDNFYGNMAAVRSGSRIVIALGGPSADFALSRIKAAVANVK